ncbi:sterol desaturase family protein [Yoonia sp. I 8.24]|uniref:sterol desaturase family protein n=1 Tax=Yoonia sp. I 8.24 TaxID=1537229 RepID=UPI001EDF5D9A|nr:sterol desaturase family protein [Yoonia sp. I 8.24]
MEWFDKPFELTFGIQLLAALAAKYVLVIVFRKRSELSAIATKNMLASIAISVMNIGAAIYFINDINAFLQVAYDTLHIPTLDPAFWDGWPLWLLCIVGIIPRDFADYWSHRAMHTRWGWPTHAAHHTDTHVNAFTGLRVHAIESVLMTMSYVILLTWLQMPEAIPIIAAFYLVHGIYVHMDLEIDHGPFKYLIASPIFHRWHHADAPVAYGKNLGNIMPLWDRIFGTYYNPGPCREQMGALSSGLADTNPFLIYIYPLQEWSRLLKESWVETVSPIFNKHQSAPDDPDQ